MTRPLNAHPAQLCALALLVRAASTRCSDWLCACYSAATVQWGRCTGVLGRGGEGMSIRGRMGDSGAKEYWR